jgi:hypothetical protein
VDPPAVQAHELRKRISISVPCASDRVQLPPLLTP